MDLLTLSLKIISFDFKILIYKNKKTYEFRYIKFSFNISKFIRYLWFLLYCTFIENQLKFLFLLFLIRSFDILFVNN